MRLLRRTLLSISLILPAGLLVLATPDPAAALVIDSYANALEINPDFSGHHVYDDLSAATTEPSEPGGLSNTIWYHYEAPADGTGAVDTCPSTSDVGSHVYVDTGDIATLDSAIGLQDACPSGNGNRVRIEFAAGDDLVFQIGLRDLDHGTNDVAGYIHVWPRPTNDERSGAPDLVDSIRGWTVSATDLHSPPGDDQTYDDIGSLPLTVWYRYTSVSAAAVGFTTCVAADELPLDTFAQHGVSLVVQDVDSRRIEASTTVTCPGQPLSRTSFRPPHAGLDYEIQVGSDAISAGDFELRVIRPPFQDDGPSIAAPHGTGVGKVLVTDEDVWDGGGDPATVVTTWFQCKPGTTSCLPLATGATFSIPACPGSSYAIRNRQRATNWLASTTGAYSGQVVISKHACPAPALSAPRRLSGTLSVAKAGRHLSLPQKWRIKCFWDAPCLVKTTLEAKLGGHWVTLGHAGQTSSTNRIGPGPVKVGTSAFKKLQKVPRAAARVIVAITEPGDGHRTTSRTTTFSIKAGS